MGWSGTKFSCTEHCMQQTKHPLQPLKVLQPGVRMHEQVILDSSEHQKINKTKIVELEFDKMAEPELDCLWIQWNIYQQQSMRIQNIHLRYPGWQHIKLGSCVISVVVHRDREKGRDMEGSQGTHKQNTLHIYDMQGQSIGNCQHVNRGLGKGKQECQMRVPMESTQQACTKDQDQSIVGARVPDLAMGEGIIMVHYHNRHLWPWKWRLWFRWPHWGNQKLTATSETVHQYLSSCF